jgi:acetyltransferase
VLQSKFVGRREDLAGMASEIGYPLVMKIAASEIIHKSDVGGVMLNLRDEQDLLRAFDTMSATIAGLPQKIGSWGVTLERMLTGGREIVLGTSRDPLFGQLIMVGVGGIYVEILKDVAFRLVPLTDVEAQTMVRSLRSYPILEGVRGELPIHFDTLYEQLARLSQLVCEFPEISEMDLNPFLFFSEAEKCVAVDARISLSPVSGTQKGFSC